MTRSHRFGLITLTLVCAGMAVSPARADLTQISGYYYGYESYTVESVVDGQIVSQYSGGGEATLSILIYMYDGTPLSAELAIGPFGEAFVEAFGTVGPQGADLFLTQPPGTPEGGVGNFSASYQSIDPTGQIIAAPTDYAVADLTAYYLTDYFPPEITGEIAIATFSGFGAPPLPEPSTLALAVSAMVVAILLHAWRGLRRASCHHMIS